MTAGATSPEHSAESRAREPGPLPEAEWIERIRRLRDEGRVDEAVRELAAFRAAFPDYDRRLPPDLRDWRVPAK